MLSAESLSDTEGVPPSSFQAYIATGKRLAIDRGLQWAIILNAHGECERDEAWDIAALTGRPKRGQLLRQFGPPASIKLAGERLNSSGELAIKVRLCPTEAWCDLMKSVAIRSIADGLTPIHVLGQVQALRSIAACTASEPWELRGEDLRIALAAAANSEGEGGAQEKIRTAIRRVFDRHHISDFGPLASYVRDVKAHALPKRSKYLNEHRLQKELAERKNSDRLPDRDAFWEFVRIVFTEKPQTFNDFMRFSIGKLLIFTGLRVGEATALPLDWRRYREYVDFDGTPAGQRGGYSTASLLRFFSEKQGEAVASGSVLYEDLQPVPLMFAEQITETLDAVVKATQPLRETLELQTRTGRPLPWFATDQCVDVQILYPILSGNPYWLDVDVAHMDRLTARYVDSLFDPIVFKEAEALQWKEIGGKRSAAFYMYFHRLKSDGTIKLRDRNGTELRGRIDWDHVYLHIGELEDYLRTRMTTKLSDVYTLPVSGGGSMRSHEFLFLQPKRSLGEARSGAPVDVSRYFSVGVMEPTSIQIALGGTQDHRSLFEAYGQTEADRTLRVNTHAFRHLQNTELFRLGVSDAIITKRFKRRSVAESYEYDHRSLQEQLDQMELPEHWDTILGGSKAAEVGKMIKAGIANGPIVNEFKAIQKADGEDAALNFLRVEADGFHSTPYGHCLNSFTVDPCPKHLECFAGCRHLSATNLTENRRHLVELRGRLKSAVEAASERPPSSIGRTNQIAHAQARLDGVERLLATPPGQQAFPEGKDFSRPERGSVLDG
ncbi:hypothetical protein ACSFBF_03560 [Variovorax sp. ZT5P49]|uniref:hypothetical protein n=1 Tax=Variovorax sp. ZT5P49 TaxID=3443733 RepID=UPI003F48EB44